MSLRAGILSFFAIFFSAAGIFSATAWNPYYDREEDTPKHDKRAYVRGSRQEMGEVILLRGGEAYITRKERQGIISKQALRVGDRVMLDSTIHTDKGAVLEILFGNNARVRLGEDSILRMVDISSVSDEGVIVTHRKVLLEKGSVRVRVRENTRLPSPVYVISTDAEAAIGKPELSCRGGVDVVVVAADNNKGATFNVLNGAVSIDRASKLMRKRDSVTVEKSQTLTLPDKQEELPEAEKMDENRVIELKKDFSFSNDPWGRRMISPTMRDPELDGP